MPKVGIGYPKGYTPTPQGFELILQGWDFIPVRVTVYEARVTPDVFKYRSMKIQRPAYCSEEKRFKIYSYGGKHSKEDTEAPDCNPELPTSRNGEGVEWKRKAS